MANEDLSKLKIDRSNTAPTSKRRRKKVSRFIIFLLVLLVVSFLGYKGIFARQTEVETATVSLVYPSQTFTLLNASGYVVAQRKAAVAAKITARLEWLGVEEGSRPA